MTGGRSEYCARFYSDPTNGFSKTLGSKATRIIGFAFKAGALPSSSNLKILRCVDNATEHVSLQLQSNGCLALVHGGTGADIAVSTAPGEVINAATWYYIELKITIDDAAGAYELRVNSVAWFSGAAVDTRNGGNASFDVVQIGYNHPAYGYFDDLYVCDDTGGLCDDFLGDVRIMPIFPNGNGTSSDFTGSDGNQVDNYLLTDEQASNYPDDDTTYVESATVGHKDTYEFEDSAYGVGTATIKGIQVLVCARKTDAAARSMCPVVRTGAADYDGDSASLGESYSYVRQVYMQTPEGAPQNWTIALVNAAQFGQKVTV